MLKTLFLNPPSFEGFDGGAGSRYQARRDVRSFRYPTWLAQPAPYPGTELYSQAEANGWLVPDDLITFDGAQDFPFQYPDLSRKQCSRAWSPSTRSFTSARGRSCGWWVR